METLVPSLRWIEIVPVPHVEGRPSIDPSQPSRSDMSILSSTRPDRQAAGSGARVDPRGQQLAAAITTVVLAVVLLLAPHPLGVALLGLQALVFATAVGLGVQHTPYAWVFRTLVRPRVGPPAELEDPEPPRFAQAVGLTFAAVAIVAFLAGATTVGLVAVGFALAAAFLNAAFGFCLGCELYLLIKRIA
jgi:hypothetical protein